jgi:hypothetical protein
MREIWPKWRLGVCGLCLCVFMCVFRVVLCIMYIAYGGSSAAAPGADRCEKFGPNGVQVCVVCVCVCLCVCVCVFRMVFLCVCVDVYLCVHLHACMAICSIHT